MKKLEEIKLYFNNYPICSARGKTPKQMHAFGGLHSQVINTSISPQIIDILYDSQNIFLQSSQNNAIVPTIEPIIMSIIQSNHTESILSSQEFQAKVKYTNIKLYIKNLESS